MSSLKTQWQLLAYNNMFKGQLTKWDTLDFIFTQLEMQLTVTGTTTCGFVSDHYMVSIELSLKSQYHQQ